jgi:hypothetical protein
MLPALVQASAGGIVAPGSRFWAVRR